MNLTASPPAASASGPIAGSADFRAVFDASPRPLLLLAADRPRFTMLAVNPAHARAFATTAEGLEGHGVFEVFPAEPTDVAVAFMEAIRTSLERVVATGAVDQMPIRLYAVAAADGGTSDRYWSATNSPIHAADGSVTHIVSAVQDVTGEVMERRSEEARRLLMREVDHRARNALTVVQSLVKLTQADDLTEFKSVVLGRIEALARAQTSLARRKWEGAILHQVVSDELAALTAPDKYELSGPHVNLPAEQVQAMSMALHELATNASKYGAFKTQAGRVSVSWTTQEPGLVLVWSELGGPPVEPPTKLGFGSRLLENLAQQLGGRIDRQWRPEGMRAELTAGPASPTLDLDALPPI